MMKKQSTDVPAYSIGGLVIVRLCRACAIPCLIAAVLLIGACDKSEPSAPQKAPAPEGPPQPQQADKPDEPEKPDRPPVVSRYTNAKNGFAIDFPTSWKLERDPDQLFAIMSSSRKEHPQDAFSENVYVMVRDLPEIMADGVPVQLSLNDYFDLSRANFPKISNDAVEHGIGQIMINGQICPWVIFTHVFNNAKWKTIRYYLRHGQRVFVIVCTATPGTFQRYSDTFQQTAESIIFE